MNIWIFNPFDALPWEGKAQRYATLASCLAARGHSVVHWSSGFSHTFKERRRLPEAFDPESLPYAIELIECPAYRSNVSLARIRNHWTYGRGLVRAGRRAVASGSREKPNLILASMPPIEGPSAARRLAALFGCRFVVDVMDAWPETLLQAAALADGKWRMGNPLLGGVGGMILWPYRRMLRRALKAADGVCAQSQAFADYARRFGAFGEVPAFYLGSTAPDQSAGDQELITKKQPTGQLPPPLRLLYLGAMGRSYDLETVFDAVAELNRDGEQVTLDMVGSGEKRAALEARQVPGVRFLGYLSGAALTERLQAADLGLVPFLPGSGVAVPYKAGDYLAHGLPVVSSIDGELGAHLRTHACGVVYPAKDAAGLVARLRDYAADRTRLAREQAAAVVCFEAHFDREAIYPRFAEWLEGLPVQHGSKSDAGRPACPPSCPA